MILVVDNYDSFTWNLVHDIEASGHRTRVVRNDAASAGELLASRPDGIVLSPGPCTPDEAGVCIELVQSAPRDLPILGVCLGHQAIGRAFGASVGQAKSIIHGKVHTVRHTGGPLLSALPSPFEATRYHSLAIDRDTLPDAFEVTAETEDGEIMAMHHRDRLLHGMQFHPESYATTHGRDIMQAFLELCGTPQ